MLILTTVDLRPYIGQRVDLSTIRVGRGRRKDYKGWTGRCGHVQLEDPRGIFTGPIFVLRELTRDEYQTELERDLGRPFTRLELVESRQYRMRFFDISMD